MTFPVGLIALLNVFAITFKYQYLVWFQQCFSMQKYNFYNCRFFNFLKPLFVWFVDVSLQQEVFEKLILSL